MSFVELPADFDQMSAERAIRVIDTAYQRVIQLAGLQYLRGSPGEEENAQRIRDVKRKALNELFDLGVLHARRVNIADPQPFAWFVLPLRTQLAQEFQIILK